VVIVDTSNEIAGEADTHPLHQYMVPVVCFCNCSCWVVNNVRTVQLTPTSRIGAEGHGASLCKLLSCRLTPCVVCVYVCVCVCVCTCLACCR
jgi:hypothetical protein